MDGFVYNGFQQGQNQGTVWDGIETWVEGWGDNNQTTADYNAAVVEQKRAQTAQQQQIVQAAIKIVGLLAIAICAVLIIKAFKK